MLERIREIFGKFTPQGILIGVLSVAIHKQKLLRPVFADVYIISIIAFRVERQFTIASRRVASCRAARRPASQAASTSKRRNKIGGIRVAATLGVRRTDAWH